MGLSQNCGGTLPLQSSINMRFLKRGNKIPVSGSKFDIKSQNPQ